MTNYRTLSLAVLPALLLGGSVCGTYAADKARPATLKVNARTVTPPATVEPVVVEIPQSEFQIPASPREGRNPFFPTSMTEAPPAPVVQKTQQPKGPDSTTIILNGITPGRSAMVNGKTFEKGEFGEVKLPSGERVSVQCLEIGKDSATILLGTQQIVLRLRQGL